MYISLEKIINNNHFKILKEINYNLFYYIGICLFVIKFFMDRTQLIQLPEIIKTLTDFAIIFTFSIKLIHQIYCNCSLKYLLALFLPFIISIITAHICGEFYFVFIYLVIFSSDKISLKNSIQIIFYSILILLSIHIIMYFICLIFNITDIGNFQTVYRSKTGTTRYYFFLNHPNIVGGTLLWLIASYFYLKWDKTNIKMIIIFLIICLVAYKFLESKTTLFAFFVLLFLLIVHKYLKLDKIIVEFAKYVIIIFSLLTILLIGIYHFRYNDTIAKIDRISSYRISLGDQAIEENGINIYSKYLNTDKIVRWGIGSYNTLKTDSLYVMCFVSYGFIYLIGFEIMFYKVLNKYNNSKYAVFIILFATVSLTEKYVLNPVIGFPVLFFGKYLFDENLNKQGSKTIMHYFKETKQILDLKGFIIGIFYIFNTLIYKLFLYPLKYFLYLTDVDDKQITFISKPDYSGNAKALYEYLHKLLPEYHFVWLIDNEDFMFTNIPNTEFIISNINTRKGFSWRAIFITSKTKYLFYTHGGAPTNIIKKKKNQIIVNLWHGCGYKNVEHMNKSWIEINPFDYALVPGELFISTKKRFWGCDEKQILTIGYPRYDYLLNDNKNAFMFSESLKKGCDNFIIWMPTFRKTSNKGFPEESIYKKFDLPLLKDIEDLDKLNNYCKQWKIMICIKRHIYQVKYSCENKNYSNIVFIDNSDLRKSNVELYSLLHYTDALISDYSSVSIDYLLINKPIAFSLDDFDEYKKTRGFVFDNPLDYMPGHHLYSLNDLIKFIDDISNKIDPYKTERNKILNVAHNPCDNYCERLWNILNKR